MRVVLDTNVLIRAVAAPEGPAGELFERIARGHLLVISPQLLGELGRALAYDRVRKTHELDDAELALFMRRVESIAFSATLSDPVPKVVPHDPDDDIIVATGVAGRADAICTRNRHFVHANVVEYCRRHAIEIVDDLQLLAQL